MELCTQVLRDVASALKAKGFFQNPNWSDDLIKNFKDVIDVKVDDSISFITDNEHEISNSFTVVSVTVEFFLGFRIVLCVPYL